MTDDASFQNKLIKDVPFYQQQKFDCGPTTLSEAFNFYSHSTTQENIALSLVIPERRVRYCYKN
jgi:hypothetical protein